MPEPTRHGRRTGLAFLLTGLCVDALLIHLVTLFTFHIRYAGEIAPVNLDAYLSLFVPFIAIILFTAWLHGLYRLEMNLSHLDILYRSTQAVTSGYFVVVTFIFYSRAFAFPRTVILISWLLHIAATTLWRMGLKAWQAARREPVRTLIIGPANETEPICRDFATYRPHGFSIVGSLPVAGRDFTDFLRETTARVEETDAGLVIIAGLELNRTQIAELFFRLYPLGVRVTVHPNLYEILIGNIELRQIAGIPLLEIRLGERLPWYGVIKRGLDVIASLVGLVLSLPIFLLAALAIRLESSGPVFYSQERLGLGRRPFFIRKFRTMHLNAEDAGPALATENDPRVTRVGYWLRRLHIDELPQFLNVLAGQMSLIGPRPERAYFSAQYESRIPAWSMRYLVRPGVTGLAQVHGRYDTTPENKLRYDLVYINNQSPLLDLKILALTLKSIFTGKDRI